MLVPISFSSVKIYYHVRDENISNLYAYFSTISFVLSSLIHRYIILVGAGKNTKNILLGILYVGYYAFWYKFE